jgi:hypothetical protein
MRRAQPIVARKLTPIPGEMLTRWAAMTFGFCARLIDEVEGSKCPIAKADAIRHTPRMASPIAFLLSLHPIDRKVQTLHPLHTAPFGNPHPPVDFGIAAIHFHTQGFGFRQNPFDAEQECFYGFTRSDISSEFCLLLAWGKNT